MKNLTNSIVIAMLMASVTCFASKKVTPPPQGKIRIITVQNVTHVKAKVNIMHTSGEGNQKSISEVSEQLKANETKQMKIGAYENRLYDVEVILGVLHYRANNVTISSHDILKITLDDNGYHAVCYSLSGQLLWTAKKS